MKISNYSKEELILLIHGQNKLSICIFCYLFMIGSPAIFTGHLPNGFLNAILGSSFVIFAIIFAILIYEISSVLKVNNVAKVLLIFLSIIPMLNIIISITIKKEINEITNWYGIKGTTLWVSKKSLSAFIIDKRIHGNKTEKNESTYHRQQQKKQDQRSNQHNQQKKSHSENKQHNYERTANKSDSENQNRSKTVDETSIKNEKRYANILGLKGKISKSDIKQAFKKTAAKYHPDKVVHLGTEFRELAEKKMKEINEAYQYFENKYQIK